MIENLVNIIKNIISKRKKVIKMSGRKDFEERKERKKEIYRKELKRQNKKARSIIQPMKRHQA